MAAEPVHDLAERRIEFRSAWSSSRRISPRGVVVPASRCSRRRRTGIVSTPSRRSVPGRCLPVVAPSGADVDDVVGDLEGTPTRSP